VQISATRTRQNRKYLRRESRKRRRAHSVNESFIERQYRNVVVGSCLLESFALRRERILAGNTVKKHKAGRVPWDKVPSLEGVG